MRGGGEAIGFEPRWDPETFQEDPPSWNCEKTDADAPVTLLGVEGGCRAIRAGRGELWRMNRAASLGQRDRGTAADIRGERWTGPLAVLWPLCSSHRGSCMDDGMKGWTRRSLEAEDLTTRSAKTQTRRRLRMPEEPHMSHGRLAGSGYGRVVLRCYGREQR